MGALIGLLLAICVVVFGYITIRTYLEEMDDE